MKGCRFILLKLLTFLLIFISQITAAELNKTPKGEVTLVYVEWSSEIASTNVVKTVLEELGYQVEMLSVSAAAMWQAVASGDADAHVAAWLPSTHAHYFAAVKDRIEDLGANLEGTKIGLVAPTYVTINSITELNANRDKFQGKIIGIDPGAGLMSKTETVFEEYHLDKFKLIEGSGATMAAALKEAVRNQQWLVVTGWTPHWKFSRWQLKYLEDPKKIYGEEEYIGTIVRQELQKDMPEVYNFLDNFHWTAADMEKVMIWNEEPNTTPEENAKRWVDENPDKVAKWLSFNK
jgi:glycine betaine/proline transport system substrate-binding protein